MGEDKEPALSGMRTIDIVDLGRTGYEECLLTQRRVFAGRRAGEYGDTLLLTEHDHVYTIGKSGDENHLLAGEEELRAAGAGVFNTDRGGDITYHGPGQLVGYPIIDLDGRDPDIHRYLRDLEEVIIRAIAEYGIAGRREPGYTGVWAGEEKIAAIGIRVAGWITMHGFALNVNTDLSYFDRIIPCGITHRGVTSIRTHTGSPVPMADVSRSVVRHFADVFSAVPRTVPAEEIQLLRSPSIIQE